MIRRMFILAILLGSLGVAGSATPLVYGTAYSSPHKGATLYSISPLTGSAKAVGSVGFSQVGALAFAPNGSLFGVGLNGASKWVLLKIDLISGAGTAVGPTGLDTPFQDISFRSDGTLFGYVRSSAGQSKAGLVYAINANTGAAKPVGYTVSGFDADAPVAFSSENLLYAVNGQSLRTISAVDAGPVTALHSSSALANSSANTVKFDANTGTLWAFVGNHDESGANYLAQIDVKTGKVAPVGKTASDLRGLAVLEPRNGAPVPLPSSLLFLLTGALALLGWSRWSRSSRFSPKNYRA